MEYENFKDLFNEIEEERGSPPPELHDRPLLIDGLNMFFRNFAMMNMVNPKGVHIGGLGGFLRSLGAMISLTNPTCVYVVFDGQGSSQSRKNILPEYKSGRDEVKITNWEMFKNIEEEGDAKVNQLTRIIHYLDQLPVKVISLPKVEADDVIAVLSTELKSRYNSKPIILSADQDFLQLINESVTVYRPMEKQFYNPKKLKETYGVSPHNFIIYKVLLGDNSDKVPGIKGMGVKKLFKLFPELKIEQMTLDDIFEKAEKNITTHIIYARIVQDRDRLKSNYKIMDLETPLVSQEDISYIISRTEEPLSDFNPDLFKKLYEQDQLGGMIRNLDYWLKEKFTHLVRD